MPSLTTEEIESIGENLSRGSCRFRLWYNKKFYPFQEPIKFTLHGQEFLITDQDELRKMDPRFNGLDLSHLDPMMDFNNPLTGKSLGYDNQTKIPNPNADFWLRHPDYNKTHSTRLTWIIIALSLACTVTLSMAWIGILGHGDITILKFLELLVAMVLGEFFVILLGHTIQMAAIHRYIPDWLGYLAPSPTLYGYKKWKILYHDRKLTRTKNDLSYQNSQTEYEITQSINEIDTMSTKNPETGFQILKAIAKHSFRTYNTYDNGLFSKDSFIPYMFFGLMIVRAMLLNHISSCLLLLVLQKTGLKNFLDSFYSNCIDYIMDVPKWIDLGERPMNSEINDTCITIQSRCVWNSYYSYMHSGRNGFSEVIDQYLWVDEGHPFIPGITPMLSWTQIWEKHLQNLKEINTYWENPDKLLVKQIRYELEKISEEAYNKLGIKTEKTHREIEAAFESVKNGLKTFQDNYDFSQ